MCADGPGGPAAAAPTAQQAERWGVAGLAYRSAGNCLTMAHDRG